MVRWRNHDIIVLITALSVLANAMSSISTPPTVTAVQTVAGSPVGSSASGSANGNGTNAKFSNPTGIEVDPATGIVYVGDYDNCIIRAISPTNAVTTIAGRSNESVCGYADSTTGTNARFDHPGSLRITGGFLYVADSWNNMIRAVSLTSGTYTVTTVAGQTQFGYVDGIGTDAKFNNPAGIVYHAATGSLLVVEYVNHLLRQVSLTTRAVTTIAGYNTKPPSDANAGFIDGTGTFARFNAPTTITVDPNTGFAYITDGGNHALRVVDVTSRTVRTLAGGYPTVTAGYVNGVGTSARFNRPEGIAYDASTNGLVVSEINNNALRWVSLSGKVVNLAGPSAPGSLSGHVDGVASVARFYQPCDVSVHPTRSGTYLIVDSGNNAIRFAYFVPAVPTNSSTLSVAVSSTHSTSGLLPISSSTSRTASLLQSMSLSSSRSMSVRQTSATAPSSMSISFSSVSQSSPRLTNSSTASLTRSLTKSNDRRKRSSASASFLQSATGDAVSPSVTANASDTPSPSVPSTRSLLLTASNETAHTHSGDLLSRTHTVPLPRSLDAEARAASVAKAQASSNVATVTSIALGGDPASASQTVFLSIVSCGSKSGDNSGHSDPPPSALTMLTISVFYEHGPLAMGFGNLGLAAFLVLMHAGVTMIVARCTQTDFATATGHRFVRFPNISVRFVAFLVPGTVYAAFLMLLDPASGAGYYVAGSFLVLLVFCLVAARHLLVIRVAVLRAQYVLYPAGAAEKSLFFVEALLFPNGRWTPQAQRFAFGLLLVPYSPRAVSLASVEICAGLCLAAATAIATTRTATLCASIMQAMSAVHFTVALWCGAMRPFRLKSDVVCVTLVYTLYGVVCILLSLHTTSALAAAADVQVFSVLLSILRMAVKAWIVWREDTVADEWDRPKVSDLDKRVLSSPPWPTVSSPATASFAYDDVEMGTLDLNASGDALTVGLLESAHVAAAATVEPVPTEETPPPPTLLREEGSIDDPPSTRSVEDEAAAEAQVLVATAAADRRSALLVAGNESTVVRLLIDDFDGYFSAPAVSGACDVVEEDSSHDIPVL